MSQRNGDHIVLNGATVWIQRGFIYHSSAPVECHGPVTGSGDDAGQLELISSTSNFGSTGDVSIRVNPHGCGSYSRPMAGGQWAPWAAEAEPPPELCEELERLAAAALSVLRPS